MVSLYYGPSIYCKNIGLKAIIKGVLDKNTNTNTKRISFESEGAILAFKETVDFRDLFSPSDKVSIIILSESREIKNKDRGIIINLLKKCEKDGNIFCYFNENIRKKDIPAYLGNILKDIKYEKHFFNITEKKEVLKYINNDLESDGYSVNLGIISKLYEVEGDNLFNVSSDAKKLSFLKYSSEELIEMILKEYTISATINDFSKALIYNNSLGYKLYMFEKFFSKNSFYNGVVAYLSKSTNNKEMIKRLANEDIKIKSGLLDPDSAILELILSS